MFAALVVRQYKIVEYVRSWPISAVKCTAEPDPNRTFSSNASPVQEARAPLHRTLLCK